MVIPTIFFDSVLTGVSPPGTPSINPSEVRAIIRLILKIDYFVELYHNKDMPKKTVESRQRKKVSKKAPKKKLKKQLKKALSKKISFTPLSLILSFLAVLLPLAVSLIIHFVTSSNGAESCLCDASVENCIDNSGQRSDKPSNNDNADADKIEGSTELDNSREPDGGQNTGSSSSPSINDASSAHNEKSQSSSSNSASASNQTSSQSSGEDLKVGSSYMGGTIPSLLDIPTCFGPTLCAWILDGSEYANIYMTENYHWGGRFLDIVNGNLVTSEKNHWAPSTNKYFHSENIPRLFSSDMVAMAKKYGLRTINKKLYLTINGVTYSFRPGYTSVKPSPTVTVPGDSFVMPPNSQVDFDISVSPWFYDPEIFEDGSPYIYNTKVVRFVKRVKKSDGVLTVTLKSGNYQHGASTGINLYGKTYVVTITGH